MAQPYLQDILLTDENQGKQGVVPDSAEPLVDAGRRWALGQIQGKRQDDYKNSLLMHMVTQHEAAPAHVQSFGEVMDRTEMIDPFPADLYAS